MTLLDLKNFLMWATILNVGLLFLSVALQFIARKYLLLLTKLIFGISDEKATEIIFAAIVFQKIITYVLFVVPFIALTLLT